MTMQRPQSFAVCVVVSRNHTAARLLLDHGARFGAVNKDGKSCLHVAMEIGDIGSAVMLLERGARVDTMDQVSTLCTSLTTSKSFLKCLCFIIL
jgi:ankyrin repeat protein